MDRYTLIELLEKVQRGDANIGDAFMQLLSLPYEQVGDFARVDHHRSLRCGFPEVIYGSGKSS